MHDQMKVDYHDSLCIAAGRRVLKPCCETVHVSLFFDGTGNNLFNDLYRSAVPHPTNIARLFRATIGNGYAGGAAGAKGLTDPPGTGLNNYFKYYMPGVGTPFPEVGDLDYTATGLAFARYGEERINWGLLMVLDALRQLLELPRLDDATLLRSVRAMGEIAGMQGRTRRRNEFNRQLHAMAAPLRIALRQPSQGRPKLVGLRLYVYGFSRGAAGARAFVKWLHELLNHEDPTQPAIVLDGHRLPVQVQYLGLLDTVASVGIADPIPGADGHMSWADNTQQLPGGNALVKRCLHLVSAHEQRLCFPLDSIRRETGGYPVNSQEVIYPGMHSDIGGGYPPGDQGKAVGESDGLLLSQITLHELYSDAFSNGAPLKVPKEAIPSRLSHELWRTMEFDMTESFRVAKALTDRFNAWRHVTLGLPKALEPLPQSETEHYQPILATDTLEQAHKHQLGWLTAWRIDRYAFASLEQTPFYRRASDTHSDPIALAQAREARKNAQKKVEQDRKSYAYAAQRGVVEPKVPDPGVKDFDPDLGKTQLREAALEFGKDFRNANHLRFVVDRLIPAYMPPINVYEVIHVDAGVECLHMKAAGRARVGQLFPPPYGFYNHIDDNHRGRVDETLNANQPIGQLRALFDDQVHDSRAWFFYSWGREPMGSYFRERMVFFGEPNRRELAINDQQQRALLAAHLLPAPPPVMTPERLAQIQEESEERFRLYRASLVEGANESA
ncbi:hypothetical protein GCM10017655_33400 [Pseudomonas turukhanskensis]|uniref:DUF2235 domain-containing protein n=2 Tax=Pseudomonas turukhanskensis TaxID=1806536 RepID=A0A9W6K7F0_9PSED|nr:hypothetical protein GCM10017655_33400 [Pseudomonas turukhanskensis]